MREPRWISNQRVREEAKRIMWDAWYAVRSFRDNGNYAQFPNLRRYLSYTSHTPFPHDQVFKISGFGILDEQVPRDEYDRMRAAWLQTEAGKAQSYMFDYDWETPAAQLPNPVQTETHIDPEMT